MNGVEGTPDKDPRATPVSSHTTHQNPGRVQQLVRKPTQHTGGRHIQSQTRPGFQQSYGNNLRSTPKQLSGTSCSAKTALYTVPLNTSVVQIITDEATYWQQPIAGYGLIPYGLTVERPNEIIALDSEGNQLGQWISTP